MLVYKGCALDHLIHRNSGVGPQRARSPKLPWGISMKMFTAMPAGHQPSSGHRQVPSRNEPQVPDRRLRVFLKSPRSQS